MNQSILSHSEGLEKIYKLRTVFELEIECICLNSNFQDISQMLPRAVGLQKEYCDQVVLKESEDHSIENPYYELSVFCNSSDQEKIVQLLKDYNLAIDLVHDNKDMWTPYR